MKSMRADLEYKILWIESLIYIRLHLKDKAVIMLMF